MMLKGNYRSLSRAISSSFSYFPFHFCFEHLHHRRLSNPRFLNTVFLIYVGGFKSKRITGGDGLVSNPTVSRNFSNVEKASLTVSRYTDRIYYNHSYYFWDTKLRQHYTNFKLPQFIPQNTIRKTTTLA